jgi:hydroxymethylglutaryl-CoA reductase (NADPH)
VLVSSVFGFIVTLFMAYLLNMTVNPVTLSEALPFMVVVIGFDKPFVLARAVFRHPAINGNEPMSEMSRIDYFNYFSHTSGPDRRSAHSSFDDEQPSAARLEPVTAKDIVVSAVNKHGVQIVRDYAIEIAVLLGGAMSGIPGLMEFCQLGALILAFDCLFLFVFYVAILTVMVEVRAETFLQTRLTRGTGSSDQADALRQTR